MKDMRGSVKILALAFLIGAAPILAAEDVVVPIQRTSSYVPVRDGTRLAMNIYKPVGFSENAKYPVVFIFTPYRARFTASDGKVVEFALSDPGGIRKLLDHGYVIAVADIRGKGASFGARRGFQDRTEAMDGHDLVGWLAAQPWSNGNVGMFGCSYFGGSAVQVATTRPPALKAIFAGASDLDKYAFVRRGGITAQFNTRPDEPLSDDLASIPVDGDVDGAMLKSAVAQHAKNTPMAPLWYGMPHRDSVSPLTGNRYWEEVGPYPYLAALRKPGLATYFWSNWQDEPTEQMIQFSANVGAKFLAGPGSHCVPPPGFDFAGELQRYFDFHLKGVDTGITREPRYTYWLENAPKGEEWVRSNTLPGVGVKRTKLYFSSAKSGTVASVNDGTLSARKVKRSTDSFTVNYAVGSMEYFAFWVKSQDEKGLTYTGAPLADDVKMVGSPILHLKLTADKADPLTFAYLEDVSPDGKVEVISFGRLAASHRKISHAPYDTLGVPWHSGRAADVAPIIPGKPVALDFGLTPVSRIFKAGHRLRISITGADPRQRDLADIRVKPSPRIKLNLGTDSGSHIALPIIK
jgi:putative CocE/NonD family hydrolase